MIDSRGAPARAPAAISSRGGTFEFTSPIIGKIVEHTVSPRVTHSHHIAPDVLFRDANEEGCKSGGFSEAARIGPAATAPDA